MKRKLTATAESLRRGDKVTRGLSPSREWYVLRTSSTLGVFVDDDDGTAESGWVLLECGDSAPNRDDHREDDRITGRFAVRRGRLIEIELP